MSDSKVLNIYLDWMNSSKDNEDLFFEYQREYFVRDAPNAHSFSLWENIFKSMILWFMEQTDGDKYPFELVYSILEWKNQLHKGMIYNHVDRLTKAQQERLDFEQEKAIDELSPSDLEVFLEALEKRLSELKKLH